MALEKNWGKERHGSRALDVTSVQMLKNFRSTHGCDLRPNRSKMLCASCPDFKECKALKGERAYIHNSEDAAVESRKRERRTAAQERKTPEELVFTPEEEAESEFPCGDMSFACPDKKNCDGGRNCRW